MIVNTDKEGATAIIQLCDVALRAGGIANIKGIQQILDAVEKGNQEPGLNKPENPLKKLKE